MQHFKIKRNYQRGTSMHLPYCYFDFEIHQVAKAIAVNFIIVNLQ